MAQFPSTLAEYCISITHTTQYENQAYVAGKWFKSPIRPHLSDSRGRIKIPEPKEDIKAPTGWRWEGIWHISPEPRCAFAVSSIWSTIEPTNVTIAECRALWDECEARCMHPETMRMTDLY